jgi:hypothetical protein
MTNMFINFFKADSSFFDENPNSNYYLSEEIDVVVEKKLKQHCYFFCKIISY